jgi:RHH-type proline utilization regulon transcriptional repressor/proline dehydrogenase/delta 1-pyrroline-5-carboxylate dehydrogenase
MGPLIRPPEGPLRNALNGLGDGESWLVEPRCLEGHGYLWSPAVKIGVEPGSDFHLTECFGPVLGVMRASDLAEALAWQNQPAYGLTGGLQALDPAEIEWWRDRVEAGNVYVNRGITGAIVGRQPFGGWKRSVVGPGAKAGGPNYVASLGRWPSSSPATMAPAAYGLACRQLWAGMRTPEDPSGLAAESNAFRYRPLPRVALCQGAGASEDDVARAVEAARAVGAELTVAEGAAVGPGVDKVRLVGNVAEEDRRKLIDAGCWIDAIPVAGDPAREIFRWVREQALSESRHRHGNVTMRRPGVA